MSNNVSLRRSLARLKMNRPMSCMAVLCVPSVLIFGAALWFGGAAEICAALSVLVALLSLVAWMRLREIRRADTSRAIAARLNANARSGLSLLPTGNGCFVTDRGETTGFLDTDLLGMRSDPPLRALGDGDADHAVVIDLRVREADFERVIRVVLGGDLGWRPRFMPFFARAIRGMTNRAWEQLSRGEDVCAANWRLSLSRLSWTQSLVERAVRTDEVTRIAWQGADLCLWADDERVPLAFFSGTSDSIEVLAGLLQRLLPGQFSKSACDWLSQYEPQAQPSDEHSSSSAAGAVSGAVDSKAERGRKAAPVMRVAHKPVAFEFSQLMSEQGDERRDSESSGSAVAAMSSKADVPVQSAQSRDTVEIDACGSATAVLSRDVPAALLDDERAAELAEAESTVADEMAAEPAPIELGERLHEWVRVNHLSTVAAMLFATLPVCGLLWMVPVLTFGMSPLLIAVVGSVVLGSVIGKFLPGARSSLIRHSDGVSLMQGGKRVQVAYSEITRLTANYVDREFCGMARSARIHVAIEGAGRVIEFAIDHDRDSSQEETANEFIDVMSEHVAVALRRQLDEFGRVDWGANLSLTANGLEVRTSSVPKRIPYREIRNISFPDGMMEISHGTAGAVVRESTASPNFFPGLALLRLILAL